ncbi:hypothetical protein BASA83_010814 [Batrachochytrium salamandrivorans]|nr:hypothetical protein BASA83_010814 [Batrachochytrium salamandrivorans]
METSLLPLSLPPMDQLLHSSKDELDEQLLLTIEHSAVENKKAQLISQSSRSSIDSIKTEAQGLKTSIKEARSSILALTGSINTTNDTTLSYLSETMALLGRLEAAKSELQSLCDINTKCSLMKACLESGDLSTAIQHYCTFFEQPHLAGEVSEAGATSNVYSFVEAYFTSKADLRRSSLHTYHQLIHKQLLAKAVPILLEMSWPKATDSSISHSILLRLTPILKLASLVQHPGILSPSSASIGPSKSYVELIELLMSPIRKSFKFHFYGKRPTNSLKKPEYYLKFILKILVDQQDFLDDFIQPFLNQISSINLSAKEIFSRSLADLVSRKLQHDLPNLLLQPASFLHTIEEVFLFDENMRENYISPELFSTTWKSCAEIVLENESVFALWADLERQATEVRFKEIVSDPDRWTMALVKMSDIDDDHTLVFSERMQSLFDAISHRCRRLQKYEQRVEFSRLVHLPVLHQFLDILSQELWRHQSTFIPINDPRYNLPYKGTRISHMACCLGSIHSIATSIRLWSKELLLYGDPSVDDTDIFSATLVSYDELIAKIAHVSIEDIMLDISESLWEYERRLDWLDGSCDSTALSSDTISQSLKEPIHTISHYLGCVKSHLSVPLFRKHFLRPVTRLIDERIWEKLVVRGQFSFRGGSQFSLDVRLGFLHSLQPMHPSPAALLPRLSEASTILALPVEATETDQVDIYSIMLAAIEDGEELMPMLERIGVFQLTSKEVREVVGRRIEALGEF